jgi:CheY-like chemotaxis protein
MPTILIADDDPLVRGLLREVLQWDGHTVLEAADGVSALTIAHSAPVDLFLCDLFKPGLNGAQTIRRFRAALPGVPVIAVTGWPHLAVLDLLWMDESQGAVRVLPKPFRPGELATLLGELLGAAAARWSSTDRPPTPNVAQQHSRGTAVLLGQFSEGTGKYAQVEGFDEEP